VLSCYKRLDMRSADAQTYTNVHCRCIYGSTRHRLRHDNLWCGRLGRTRARRGTLFRHSACLFSPVVFILPLAAIFVPRRPLRLRGRHFAAKRTLPHCHGYACVPPAAPRACGFQHRERVLLPVARRRYSTRWGLLRDLRMPLVSERSGVADLNGSFCFPHYCCAAAAEDPVVLGFCFSGGAMDDVA